MVDVLAFRLPCTFIPFSAWEHCDGVSSVSTKPNVVSVILPYRVWCVCVYAHVCVSLYVCTCLYITHTHTNVGGIQRGLIMSLLQMVQRTRHFFFLHRHGIDFFSSLPDLRHKRFLFKNFEKQTKLRHKTTNPVDSYQLCCELRRAWSCAWAPDIVTSFPDEGVVELHCRLPRQQPDGVTSPGFAETCAVTGIHGT